MIKYRIVGFFACFCLLMFFSGFHCRKKIKGLDGYVFMESGSVMVNGTRITCQAFYIKSTEVTNREYRVFLTDLKQHGRTADLRIAAIDTSRWDLILGKGNIYSKYYHSNPFFDNYPVVNISMEAAMLYCNWISEKIQRKNKRNTHVNPVRLPLETEWVAAARALDEAAIYPWNGNSVKDEYNHYRCNYNFDKSSYRQKLNDTTWFIPLIYPVLSFRPNKKGIYEMAGNVNEMVMRTEGDRQVCILKGGSWHDGPDLMKIDAYNSDFSYTGPSPFTGFRPVMTYL